MIITIYHPSYYIMSSEGELLERLDEKPTQDELAEYLAEFEVDGAWVIEGETIMGVDKAKEADR